MKTIGLIGGMSWESSLEYYRIINHTIKEELGGFHSAKILLYSVDFAEVERLQHAGDWLGAGKLLVSVAQKLEKAGADFLLICTNTMHKLAEEIEQNVQIPLLHIADLTAKTIQAQGLKKVGLLGTKFTMEEGFYRQRIADNFPIEVIVPREEDREIVHRVIYQELCLGKIEKSSQEQFKSIISRLVEAGAEGVILGCTEIPLLIKAQDCPVPLFDTTQIHAQGAASYAIRMEESK